jgi:acetyl-CoA acetyltransferase
MRQNVCIAGVGMTTFGKHITRGLKSLASEAIRAAVDDAGIALSDIEAAYHVQCRRLDYHGAGSQSLAKWCCVAWASGASPSSSVIRKDA